jgi:TRAP-type transport system periplasmic protein
MENKVHMDGYKTFGILPTPMAFPEVFGALQQGVIDGQENPIPVILASKFSQVQKHLSLTGHVYSPAMILMSGAVYNKLNDTDKKIFTEAAKKGGTAMRNRVSSDEARGVAQLKSEGMQIVEKVDGDSFRKAVQAAQAGYAKEFGAERIAAIQAVK